MGEYLIKEKKWTNESKRESTNILYLIVLKGGGWKWDEVDSGGDVHYTCIYFRWVIIFLFIVFIYLNFQIFYSLNILHSGVYYSNLNKYKMFCMALEINSLIYHINSWHFLNIIFKYPYFIVKFIMNFYVIEKP